MIRSGKPLVHENFLLGDGWPLDWISLIIRIRVSPSGIVWVKGRGWIIR